MYRDKRDSTEVWSCNTLNKKTFENPFFSCCRRV